ncbi:TLP18.3, Psb32 and MOLO-1 founding protein of phosphatase [Paenimyroides ummariense]|uniref:TLP18.3, Psb32 and MOLO-1 founding protein of phosphatase n=1 Tax=Paenimyroides ummariense TaxID=913024 RepID=A0A1I5F3R0_9FLAO|nr:TPM domain-containing protein [Paenimyroides ummariense]SFO18249.1 TLP18.3, Psb32 and MOLO-1 founding protein of phosphatase [Paenimyroides ummariense]
MPHLLYIMFYCVYSTAVFGQANPENQKFAVEKERVVDNEKIFTDKEIKQLDSIVNDCWEKGIAEIAIVTIDKRHTDKAHFNQYVFNNLTGYAQGAYGKNNGIVIAISRQLRKIRIQNGYGTDKLMSDEATKKIIDEYFRPEFQKNNYFEGTWNGLSAIISYVEKKIQQYEYSDVSSIFRPSLFQKISGFVLENGTPKTFRNLDSDNPSYNFTSLDVFLGPARKNAFVLKDFLETDYYEMTIRDNDGKHYQFICFDEHVPEQTFIKKNMQVHRVYWLKPGNRLISKDVWPLLYQIEDEMTQNSASSNAKKFTDYDWQLKQEFHPMERIYTNVGRNETIAFIESNFFINGEKKGTFEINENKRILSILMDEKQRPSFAIFKMEDRYYYHYHFNKTERKLYLIPLDEKEGHDLISVEGSTLVFEILEP